MNKLELKYIITTANYLTKYEPIIDIISLDVYGYEALSKFETKYTEISTEEIFKKLHRDNELFFRLEKRNKELQSNNFMFKGKKLFLNFDADICTTKEQKEHWKKFFKDSDKDLVIEITENGSDDEVSANVMKNFSFWLKENGIKTALDDFAQDGSMFSFTIMENSEYIKIDKSFIKQINKNLNYKYYLQGVLETIRRNGKKSIIEGIETEQDLNLVKELGADFVQGYLFLDKVVLK